MKLDAVTKVQIAEVLELLLSAGLRRHQDAPTDPDRLVEAWYLACFNIPTVAIRAAMEQLVGEDRAFMPTAGQFAAAARKHLPAAIQRARVDGACLDPYCDCEGDSDYVTGIESEGPRVRRYAQHEARVRRLQRVDEVVCPHEGCSCQAVECLVPTTYERLSERRFSKSGQRQVQTPKAVGSVAPAELTIPRMRTWLWECEADRVGAQLVKKEVAA